MSKEKLTKKNDSCSCQCDCQTISDPSRRNFIKQATTLTIIGGSAFILEACGGGGSSPTSSDDGTGGGDTGGGNATVTFSFSNFNTLTVDGGST